MPGAAAAELLLGRLDELEPGIERSSARGSARIALRVPEVAGVLEGDAQRQRVALRRASPAASASEMSTTGRSSPASFRCEPQPAAFVTIVSAPAALERAAARRASSSPCSRRPACSASAPQQPP